MGITRTIVTAALTALGLAAWNLYLNPFYHEWIKSQGKNVGLAEEAFGYFIVLIIIWIFAKIITRKMEEKE